MIHKIEQTYSYQLASENSSKKVEMGILKTNSKTIQPTKSIFLQTDKKLSQHAIIIMNRERPSTTAIPTTKKTLNSINRRNCNQTSEKKLQ